MKAFLFKNFRTILFVCVCSVGFTQNAEMDSLKLLLKTKLADTSRLAVLHQLVDLGGGPETAAFNTEMLMLAEKGCARAKPATAQWRRYMYYIGTAYHYRGVYATNQADFATAQKAYRKSISVWNQVPDKTEATFSEMELAKLLTFQGNYPAAIDLLYKGLRQFEELKEEEGQGDACYNIALVYNKQKNLPKTIEFLEKARKHFQAAGITSMVIESTFNLISSYSKANDPKRVLQLFEENQQLFKSAGEGLNIAATEIIYVNRSLLFYKEKQIDSAIYLLRRAIAINITSGNQHLLAARLRMLGEIYLRVKNYPLALQNLNEALKVSSENKNPEENAFAAKRLYEVYKATGNEKKALELFEHSVLMNDSALKLRHERQILERHYQYEADKKALLSKLEFEKTLAQLNLAAEKKNARSNLLLLLLGSVLLIAGIVVFFLIRHFRQKSVIKAQEANLLRQKLLASQMNPHFIFNSLNAIQNYILKQEAIEAGVYLSEFSEMIRMMLTFLRKDFITLESEIRFLELYIHLQQLRFDKTFAYELSLRGDLRPEQALVPPLLAQPFVENAIEHGLQGMNEGKLSVVFEVKGNELHYTIEDNGRGIQENKSAEHKAEHESLAIKITSERISTIYNRKNSVHLTDKGRVSPANRGVQVTFAIPYKEA